MGGLRGLANWKASGYGVPAPDSVKRALIWEFGRDLDMWIETGTFLGDTAAWLGRSGKPVLTIEPSSELFQSAERRFAKSLNIRVVFGESQNALGEVLASVHGSVGFWLDGHYSGQGTFGHELACPVLQELGLIGAHLERLEDVVVFVDDARLFLVDADYPPLEDLVEWAHSNNLWWLIQNDIFIACSQSHFRTIFRR